VCVFVCESKYMYIYRTMIVFGFRSQILLGKDSCSWKTSFIFLEKIRIRCLVLVFPSALFTPLLLVTNAVSHKMSGSETVFQYEVTVMLTQKSQDVASVLTKEKAAVCGLVCVVPVGPAPRAGWTVCFAFAGERRRVKACTWTALQSRRDTRACVAEN